MSLPSLLSLGESHGWSVSLIVMLVKATLILITALGITLAMQRASAGARHLVWLVTLGALMLVPALTAWGPLRLEILPAAASSAVDAAPAPVATIAPPTISAAPTTADRSIVSAPVADEPSSTERASVVATAIAAVRAASLGSILLATWGFVALGILVSLVWSTFTVRRLVRRSVPLDDQAWRNPLYEVSDRLGLTEAPRLLLSHEAKMPFACGLLQPTIVLPAECETWSQDRRLAVLLHELAHVRRHDLVGHTLGRLVCAVYWFHPLAWTAARQLRSESERACDDLALSCGTRATDYAEHLLDIVTSVRREGTPMIALAMARRKEFEGRMLAILDPELVHSTPSRRQSAALIVTLALISVVVGAAAPAQKAATRSQASVADERQSKDTTTAQSTAAASALAPAPSSSPSAASQAMAQADSSSSAMSQPNAATESHELSRIETRVDTRLDTQTSLSMQVRTPSTVRISSGSGVVVAQSPSIAARINEMVNTAISGVKKDPQDDERPALLAKVLRTDSSASLRRVAAWGLHEYAEQQVAADALASALRRDSDESVREMAAWALGEGDEHSVAVEALRAALHSDASVAVRKTAAWALGNVGDEGAVSTLVGALGDANADVRYRAIWALGNIAPKQAPKQLIALLSDKDERVRGITAWALFQIEDASAAPALQAALRAESDKDLQLSYIRALAAMGDKSVDAIRPLLESSDPR
ncbi:MAG TPA: M56 family metallopeptidase, partial [Gemmatimonadaceae bacterium]|nr:M56 family metallopeptidase [Gemmatimonadaceae bacterium]